MTASPRLRTLLSQSDTQLAALCGALGATPPPDPTRHQLLASVLRAEAHARALRLHDAGRRGEARAVVISATAEIEHLLHMGGIAAQMAMADADARRRTH